MRVLLVSLLCVCCAGALGQQPRLAFDIISLRENKSGVGPGGEEESANVPLGPGNVYSPTQGQLNLHNIDLMQIISFAYKLTGMQHTRFIESAPEWAREARYDLRARTDNADVTKDELRAMVQSLLAERFGLKVHTENQTSPVYAMQFVKAGVPGPHFRAHEGQGCPKDFKQAGEGASELSLTADGYPVVCGGLLLLAGSAASHFKLGARDMPISVFTTSLTSWGDLGRPVVNDTGMTGNIDFLLDFVTPQGEAAGTVEGDSFRTALKKQLGITLDSQKRAVPVLLLDAITRPTEN